MKILAIIPARGGSKGIKNKNIIDVCGKPLIQYSIDLALDLKAISLVDEVIVSTDSDEIKKLSEGIGASVPFLRPSNISGDKAKSINFILHAIEYYEDSSVYFDAVLLLQPTSPLRNVILLKNAIHLFIKNSNSNSLISCYKEEYINDLVMYKSNNNNNNNIQLEPLNLNHNKGVRRQDHAGSFVRNGSVYLTKVSYLKETNQIISENPLLLEMKKSQSINLDTLDDLEILKRVLCK